MRRYQRKPLLFWMSAKTENDDKRFLQVGNSLLLSKKFQGLTNGAKILYLAMAMESGGKLTFSFPLHSAKKYGITSSTLRRNIKELENAEFIKILEHNGNIRKPNTYCFARDWKTPPPGNI